MFGLRVGFIERCVRDVRNLCFVRTALLSAGNIGVDGAGMVLESCAGAVAAGDGRDLFILQAGGQLLNVAGGKCAVLQSGDVADGGKLVFGECDAASQWEVLGNGQLKLDGPGDFCLSQSGLVPGRADVAANAAVSASSTANAIAHGALYPSSHKTHWVCEHSICVLVQERRWLLTIVQ